MSWRTRLALVGAAILAGALLLVAWSAQQRAARAAEEARAAERARLEAEGLLAAERASRARLEREAQTLREQLARVRRAAPGARVREVTRWRTREIEVPCPPVRIGDGGSIPIPDFPGDGGDPIVIRDFPGDGSTMLPTYPPQWKPRPAPGGDHPGPDEAPPAGGPSRGSSSVGSVIRIELLGTEARVETRAGQTVAIGEVEVWRTTPPPRALIAREPIQMRLHLVDRDDRPRARWAAGPAVGVVSGHWAVGAVAVGPSLRAWRLEARPVTWALAGGGEWVAAAGLAVAW